MNHKQEAGGTSSDSHMWSYLVDWRQSTLHRESTSLLIMQSTYMEVRETSAMEIHQQFPSEPWCVWSPPNTFSNFDSCRVCWWFAGGERIEIVQSTLTARIPAAPAAAAGMWKVHSPKKRKRRTTCEKKKIIHFAIILLELPKSFNLQTSNGLTVHLQSFCCSLSLFSAKVLAGWQSSV